MVTRHGLDTEPGQMSSWIHERWPSAELLSAVTPEDAVKTAIDARIENIILDLDFGAQHCSGVVVARKVLEARVLESRTRICYEAIIRGWVNPQPGFDRVSYPPLSVRAWSGTR